MGSKKKDALSVKLIRVSSSIGMKKIEISNSKAGPSGDIVLMLRPLILIIGALERKTEGRSSFSICHYISS